MNHEELQATQKLLEEMGFQGPLWDFIMQKEKELTPCAKCGSKSGESLLCTRYVRCSKFHDWKNTLLYKRTWWRKVVDAKGKYKKITATADYEGPGEFRMRSRHTGYKETETRRSPIYTYRFPCMACHGMFTEAIILDEYTFCSDTCLSLGPGDF